MYSSSNTGSASRSRFKSGPPSVASRSSSYTPGSRPSFGASRGPSASRGFSSGPSRSRFSSAPKRSRFGGQFINESKYINKAVVSNEPVKEFIPQTTFSALPVDEQLKANILAKGFDTPTPIQDAAIPHIMAGKDIVGIANTGTGKTAAFLIPLIDKIIKGITLKVEENILIVAPTRELAIQIDEELKLLTKGMKIYSVCVVGGAPIRKQMAELRYHNNFIIGTPGRLKDLIERKWINLKEFNTAVLDEADRMLEMGFVADMKYMMALMPKEKQTLFFSATLSSDIEKLIKDFLRDPVRVSVKTGDTSKNVDQDVVRVQRGHDKMEVLHDLLNKEEFNKVLIFGKTKHGVEKLSKNLIERGFKAESIHGDKQHSQRQRALSSFKENKVTILVATDVAARGLDIPNVSHVINFDIPATYDDYVHRIGRTGRGGKSGKALTFVDAR